MVLSIAGPLPPIPVEYPSVHIEKLMTGYIVTIEIPNSMTRPPRYVVQTLDEVCEIVTKWLRD